MFRSVALALALFSICRLCAAQDTMSGVVDFRFATVKRINDAFSVAVMIPTGKTKIEEKDYTVMKPYTENGQVKYLAERRTRTYSVPILETKLIKLGPESKFEDLRSRRLGQATLLNSTILRVSSRHTCRLSVV